MAAGDRRRQRLQVLEPAGGRQAILLHAAAARPTGGQNLQIRTRLGPERIATALAHEVKAIDSNLAPGEVITMREQVDRMSWSRRAA